MALIDRLERRFGRFAIPHSVNILLGFQVVVWLLLKLQPRFIEQLFFHESLLPQAWRLVTWTFIPPVSQPILLLFMIFITIMISRALEEAWGAFRVNLYLLGGILAQLVGAILFGGIPSSAFLETSIFLAFVMLYPNRELLLFLILPLKVKYIGMITAAMMVLSFIEAKHPTQRWDIVFSFVNFFVAFGSTISGWLTQQGQVKHRRAKFKEASLPLEESFHRCESCGKTDVTDPKLEFRVTADGGELCVECLDHRKNREGVVS